VWKLKKVAMRPNKHNLMVTVIMVREVDDSAYLNTLLSKSSTRFGVANPKLNVGHR